MKIVIWRKSISNVHTNMPSTQNAHLQFEQNKKVTHQLRPTKSISEARTAQHTKLLIPASAHLIITCLPQTELCNNIFLVKNLRIFAKNFDKNPLTLNSLLLPSLPSRSCQQYGTAHKVKYFRNHQH